MNYSLAIMGDEDAIYGFRAVGVHPFPISHIKEAKQTLNDLYHSDKYAVIFITEDWAERLQGDLLLLKPKALPAIVAVPTPRGSTGEGLKNLKKIVEKAVGSNILNT